MSTNTLPDSYVNDFKGNIKAWEFVDTRLRQLNISTNQNKLVSLNGDGTFSAVSLLGEDLFFATINGNSLARTATIPEITAYANGIVIIGQPTYALTMAAGNTVTLKVNSLSAITIKGNSESLISWDANSILIFTYYNGYFYVTGDTKASVNSYGITKLTSDHTSNSETLAASAKYAYDAYDLATTANTAAGTNAGNISNLQTDVGNLQTDVGNLQTDMGTAQGNISTLQGDVGTLQDGAVKKTTINISFIAGRATSIGSAIDINRVISVVAVPTTTLANIHCHVVMGGYSRNRELVLFNDGNIYSSSNVSISCDVYYI